MLATLPDNIHTVLRVLSENGFGGYLVGGCVRDRLLGKTPGDYDITTDALPAQTKECFRAYRVFETGLRHGTVTVVADGENVEITTFRLDGDYTDNRHPASVTFTDRLADDLRRRDFTINAMAWSEKTGLVDLFGGQEDLQNRLLRCVGDPDTRFREDGLRILRALRFASVLDFTVDEGTAGSIRRNASLLANISRERIYAEMCRLLCGQGAERILLEFASVITFVAPLLAPTVGFRQNNPHHCYDVYTHTARCVSLCPPEKNIRLAAFFHDAGKPETYSQDENGVGHFYDHRTPGVRIARDTLCEWRADNAAVRTVTFLVDYHDRFFGECSERTVRRLLRTHSPAEVKMLCALMRADSAATGTRLGEPCVAADRLEEMTRRLCEQKACLCLRDLAVDGNTLLDLGAEPKTIGSLLQRLLDLVTDGELPNEAPILTEELKKWISTPI